MKTQESIAAEIFLKTYNQYSAEYQTATGAISLLSGDFEKAVCYLYILANKWNWTRANFKGYGIDQRIVDATMTCIKREDERVSEYLARVKSNKVSNAAKIALLCKEISLVSDREEVKRIAAALNYLA